HPAGVRHVAAAAVERIRCTTVSALAVEHVATIATAACGNDDRLAEVMPERHPGSAATIAGPDAAVLPPNVAPGIEHPRPWQSGDRGGVAVAEPRPRVTLSRGPGGVHDHCRDAGWHVPRAASLRAEDDRVIRGESNSRSSESQADADAASDSHRP